MGGFNKPNQAKVFYHDGSWWAAAADASDGKWYLWKYTGSSWSRSTKIDSRNSSRPGIQLDAASNTLYVALSHRGSSRFARLTYSAGTWTMDSGFPVSIPGFSHYDEDCISLAIAANGDLWVSRINNSAVEVKRSTDGGATWGSNIVLKTGLNIATGLTDIVAYTLNGVNYIGVGYAENTTSNSVYGFLYHREGDPASSWTDESSQLGMFAGGVHADNHIAMAADAQGNVYMVVKTGGGAGASAVKIGLYKRTASGWSMYTVMAGNGWTRPAVVVDNNSNELYLLGTNEGAPKTGQYKKVSFGNESALEAQQAVVIIENGSEAFTNISAPPHSVDGGMNMMVLAENITANTVWSNLVAVSGGTVQQAPVAVASASPLNGTAPLDVQFTGSSSYDPDGTISSYAWDFGDGIGTSNETNPLYTYNDPGTFSARLVVTDNDGLTDTAYVSITVSDPSNQKPTAVASADVTSGDAPLTVNFTGSGSSDSDGTISSYAWDFGDGGTSTLADPSYTYNTAGNYTAQLVVTDDGGLTDTATVAITVNAVPNEPPVATITQPNDGDSFVVGSTINYAGTGTDPEDGDLAASAFSWFVTTPSAAEQPLASGVKSGSAVANEVGTYVIRLEVVDSEGATASDQISITVTASAKIAASDSTVLAFARLGVPERYDVSGAYPNPFSLQKSQSGTRIRLALPQAQQVRVEVYNVLGQRVATLLQDQSMQAGYHVLRWDGRSSSGQRVPAGLYFIKVRAGELQKSVRISILR